MKNIPRDKRASPLVEEALLIVLGLLCIMLLLGAMTGVLAALAEAIEDIVLWPLEPFKWLFPQ